MRKAILCAIFLLGAVSATACDEESEGSGGSGGAGASGGSAPSGNGTCENTCEKSVALDCPDYMFNQAECVASCEMQKASCSAMSSEFQAFLDCIINTPMKCGSASGTPTSEECVAQGFAIFACASGM